MGRHRGVQGSGCDSGARRNRQPGAAKGSWEGGKEDAPVRTGVKRGGGEQTKGEGSERGGRWEGVAPGWDGGEAPATITDPAVESDTTSRNAAFRGE